jgi:hypothetical protein
VEVKVERMGRVVGGIGGVYMCCVYQN